MCCIFSKLSCDYTGSSQEKQATLVLKFDKRKLLCILSSMSIDKIKSTPSLVDIVGEIRSLVFSEKTGLINSSQETFDKFVDLYEKLKKELFVQGIEVTGSNEDLYKEIVKPLDEKWLKENGKA